jgi:hypothetical protein
MTITTISPVLLPTGQHPSDIAATLAEYDAEQK